MSAVYFHPIDRLSRFIFSDGTVLGFTFELGTEYDKPVVSTLSAELKKYGVNKGPTSKKRGPHSDPRQYSRTFSVHSSS